MNNNLKWLRIKKGYSQGEFAKLIGLSVTHYNRIENGKVILIPDYVFKAKKELDCSLDDMFDQKM